VERGDTGLGRDAYGPPRRERDRRGYSAGPYPADEGYPVEEDDAPGSGRRLEAGDDGYGQLLRRPGEVPPRQPRMRQPGRPQPGQPGRFPPGAPPHGPAPHGPPPHGPAPHGGSPNAGPYPGAPYVGGPRGGPNGAPPNGAPPNGAPPQGAPPNSAPPNGAPPSGGHNGGGASGGMGPGRYRLPNGRRVAPGADRMFRPSGPSTPGGTTGRHHGPGPTVKDHYADSWSGTGTAPPGSHVPGGPGPGGSGPGGSGPGGSGPGGSGPGGAGPRGPAGGPRHAAADGRDRPGPPDGRDRPGPPPEPPGPVIRQRDTARPEDQSGSPAQPVASIAPDNLEAFARDLRALRARADLDYPEMAETSHFEMKTLAAAAGGLRLPTLPVAVAFVRACGGNVAEWEERWQKIADRLTAEAAKKRRGDAEESAEPVEPADTPAALEPPKPADPPPPEPDGGEVYVITSAPPRQPGW